MYRQDPSVACVHRLTLAAGSLRYVPVAGPAPLSVISNVGPPLALGAGVATGLLTPPWRNARNPMPATSRTTTAVAPATATIGWVNRSRAIRHDRRCRMRGIGRSVRSTNSADAVSGPDRIHVRTVS